MPIDTQLRNGDEVEIETAKGQTPARRLGEHRRHGQGALRHPPRRARRGAQAVLASSAGGCSPRAFEQLGEELTDDKLKKALSRLTQKSLEEVLAAVGRNELPIEDVMRAVMPEAELAQREGRLPPHAPLRACPGEEGWFNIDRGDEPQVPLADQGSAKAAGAGLAIRGVKDDLPVTFEPGGAVPGDRIVGVLDPTARASASSRSTRPG